MKNSHISDDIRRGLANQPPEIRKGVLAVADAPVNDVTAKAHVPYERNPFHV
jgi:hypothetical protein